MEQLGINVDDFAEKRIQRKIEEMSKSPEQIEAAAIKAQEYDGKNLDMILLGAGIGAGAGLLGLLG